MKNNVWQILRTDLSSYQGAKFLSEEAKALAKCHPAVNYLKKAAKFDSSVPVILITNTHTNLAKVPKQILNNCKLIVHPNSGHDNFTTKPTIPVVLGNSIRAPIVVEYVLSSLLKAVCPIPQDKKWRKDRSWERDLLKDKKILLIGFGVIGKMVAPILEQLSPKNLFIHDPFISATQFPQHTFIEEKECKNFDVVIVCASLTSSSHHLINLAFLKAQKSGLILINSARGSIVEEKSLLLYLKQKIGKAAQIYLDVFESEPHDFKAFKKYPQVNCTSHIAGVSKKLNSEIVKFETQVIKDFINHADDFSTFEKMYGASLLKDQPS